MEATETPAAEAAPELSLDQIVEAELKAADAAGQAVAEGEKPAETAAAATETPADPPAEDPPADEPKPDDVTAARVRKMLADVEARTADLDAREKAGIRSLLDELRKAPKAFLAKHGADIDEIIDASVAEGKVAPAEDDEKARLTALEKRIAEREEREATEKHQAQVQARVAEIHREVQASTKFPVLNETKRHGLVTDFMLEYHATHGKPIAWDQAAALVEKDLTGIGIAAAKKLGWTPPAAKAEPPKERPGTTSIGGAQSTAAAPPSAPPEDEDPETLLRRLVREAGPKLHLTA